MEMNENKIIEIKKLYKNYGSLEVLTGIDLDIYKGEVIAVIGSSGSGKSTLLRCLNLLEEPTSGDILFNGININDKTININKIREEIGMVFHSFNLFAKATIA